MKSFTPFLRYLLWLLCLAAGFAAAAQPVLSTRVSTKSILIGEPVELQWEARLPGAGFIQWPALPDSMPHFEWLEQPLRDTSFNGSGISGLRQRIRFTSFDSGEWVFPAFAFRFTPVGRDTVWELHTDSVLIKVGFATDSTGALRDIKPVRSVAPRDYTWYWVGGAAAALLLVLAALWYWRRRPRQSLATKTEEDAFAAAMRALEALDGWNLHDAAVIRQYHQRMYDLLRQYLGQRTGITAHNKTTSDILVHLRGGEMSAEDISAAAAALRSCDAVKFAQYLPAPAESAGNRTAIIRLLRRLEDIYRVKPSA